MATIKTVAVAGASGELGIAIVKALLATGFTVTALTRPDSNFTAFPDGVALVRVDYSDPESLRSALRGQNAVVSAVGYSAFRGQEALIDAAIAVGVQRIIPSEYGADPDNAPVRALPVFADKVRVEKYIKARTRESPATTYTLVCNNQFLDWDIDHAFCVDFKKRTMTMFDGGDVVHTVTPIPFVARGVAAVLQHPKETANRVVRLHGAALTQNRFLRMVQDILGKENWEIARADTEEQEKLAYKVLRETPEDWMGWGLPFLQASVWGKRFGGDMSERNDNALLGLEEMTAQDLRELIQSRS